MLSSVSCFKIGFLIIPFDEFKVVCSVTSTGTPKDVSLYSNSSSSAAQNEGTTNFVGNNLKGGGGGENASTVSSNHMSILKSFKYLDVDLNALIMSA